MLALHGAALGASSKLRWAAYCSSTGVYGEHGGAWIDERCEARGGDCKALARLRAEREWRAALPAAVSLQIFRLGGIYGAGRSLLDAASDAAPRTFRRSKPASLVSKKTRHKAMQSADVVRWYVLRVSRGLLLRARARGGYARARESALCTACLGARLLPSFVVPRETKKKETKKRPIREGHLRRLSFAWQARARP